MSIYIIGSFLRHPNQKGEKMLKILRNLKKSFWSVVIIVVLLCLQAATDLALPEYTSKIVNIGIQAGGIETAIPEIIAKEDMDNLLKFTQEDNQILENYTLVGKKPNKQEEKIIKKYLGRNKQVEADTIYTLKEMNKEEKQELSDLMANPLMAWKITKNMSAEQQNQVLSQYTSKIEDVQDSIKEQAAISIVKELYKKIGVDTDKLQNDYILKAGMQMLGIASITMISAISIMLLSSRVAAKLGKTLRDKVFKKVIHFSNKELSEFSTASLITRSTNDIQQIQQLITMLFRVVVYAPIIGIGGFVKVLTTSDSQMAWIIGVAILAISFIVGTLFIMTMPKFKKLQELVDKVNQVAREILTGLPVIRAFHKEKKEEARFEVANTNLMKTDRFVSRAMSMMMPLLMIVMNSIMILIVWVGGHNVDQGIMQVGDMMAFIQYTMQIVMAFLMISMISIMLPRAAVSARRINEVIETKPSIQDLPEVKEFDRNKKGLVEFKNVSFHYPDADTEVLSDINFTAKPGETTAIIGSTGSGKSTVVNLLPRFYDVTGGELLIDGVNVKEVSQKKLRDLIGFVPQKGILFSGTIESNIKYADETMSDEQMKEAAEIAQATDFIEEKEKQFKEPIAQGGSNVSGGQKQRLSIARAIAKDPEIFVFDDSFSALDFKTDSKLREALASKTKNKTVIIVAQRISTIMNAEKIVVLEEGNVVGIGTHEELMKENETYRQIALSQLSEEELGKKGGE